jgi:hypothetical protein
MRNILVTALILASLLPASARAHDASLHKGKPTYGDVVAIEQGRLTLRTENGTHPVTLNADTKIEKGGTSAHEKAELGVGQHVAVFGTKLPGGEIVAKEVVVGAHEGNDDAAGHHHDDAHSADR